MAFFAVVCAAKVVLLMALVTVVCDASQVVPRSSKGVKTCSSLNGPFCQGFGLEFVAAPPHAGQNLDVDEEVLDSTKDLKIEKVLTQYELQNAKNADVWSDKDEMEFLQRFEMLLEESMELLNEEEKVDDKNPTASALDSSSTYAALELLRQMSGDELKKFFEMALVEVIIAGRTTLQELPPHTLDSIHVTINQLKALRDYSTYQFQLLDELKLITIRLRFATDRLVELQQAFENLVIADNAQDRQVAFETAVYLFQLAEEVG